MYKIKKLNLGCGKFPKDGYINLDIDKNSIADIFWDLREFPYPFENNSFSLIEACHVIEHLPEPLDAIKELNRILTPGGKLIMKVPHFSRGNTHPDHKRGFDVSLPYYFSPTFKGGYTGVEFISEKIKLRWTSQPYLKKQTFSPFLFFLLITLGAIIDFLANLSPAFCSRVWCFFVGGFEEIEFSFIKTKQS
ncbi:methyltransferase domain-containing protein [Patescibacteria group bacterium]